jgi:hypothetical protein
MTSMKNAPRNDFQKRFVSINVGQKAGLRMKCGEVPYSYQRNVYVMQRFSVGIKGIFLISMSRDRDVQVGLNISLRYIFTLLFPALHKHKRSQQLIHMKRQLLIFALTCLTSWSSAQKIGLGVAYATSNALAVDFLLRQENNLFRLGGSLQFSDRRGKEVENQLSNYGQTIDGTGEYFLTIDLGYGRVVKDNWTIDTELSIGSNRHYTNYIDHRFNGDGYHIVTNKESIVGFGGNIGYIMKDHWNFFTGFNSVRKLQFGIRIWL